MILEYRRGIPENCAGRPAASRNWGSGVTMPITELEQSLSTLNGWRIVCLVLAAAAAAGILIVQLQYNRTDAQLRAERAAETLREQERIARIENDTARALVLLAWRRLDEAQFRIISDGLKDPKIDKLQVAALAGDPEATLFATDILRATKEAGYGDIRMGQMVSSGPYVGLYISGPAQEVARLVALFAQAGFRDDVKRQETGQGPVTISIGSKPPPRSN